MRSRTIIIAVAVAASLVLATFVGLAQVPRSASEGSGPGTVTAPPPVHFTASGDFSNSDEAGAVLNYIGAARPDLHLALGDLSYGSPGSEQAWCNFVTARVGASLPFQLVAGNHESNGINGHIDNFTACLPNRLPGLVGEYGRQYYVDMPRGNPLVRFIMISPALIFENDETWSYTEGTPRYRWTENAIDSAREDGVQWVVVGMHKPCLSVGTYGCDPGKDLMNLLLKKRVDLVLSGHEHLYARTHQLALGTACPEVEPGRYAAECVSDDDASMVRGEGTVFAIPGSGGVELRDVNPADPEAPYFAAWSGSNHVPTWGNLDITATTEAMTASFEPTGGAGFTDSFTISGESPQASTVLAADSFSRHVPNGLGRADVGGAWATTGSASRYRVDGEARIGFSPRPQRNDAYLTGVSSTATDLRFTVSATSGTPVGATLAVTARRVPRAGAYQAKLVLADTGRLRLSLVKVDATGTRETVLDPAVRVPRLTPSADRSVEVRLQVSGTGPTTVRAKAWASGNRQPSKWLRSATDGTPSLQRPGGLGFSVYAARSGATAPAAVILDDLRATAVD